MPIFRKAGETGIFGSSEVALLGRVFDKLKDEHQSEARREVLASRLIANYQAGITEAELFAGSKLSLGH